MYKLTTVIEFEQEIEKLYFDYGNGQITWIPMNEFNSDYQTYLSWVEKGNTPERVGN